MTMISGKHIAVVSNEGWGDVWYSKHNYAYELAKNNRVIFIDPTPRWEPMNLLRSSFDLEAVSDTLSVLRYKNRLPALTHRLFKWNNTLVSRAIRKKLADQGERIDLFLTFDPARLFDPASLGATSSVFIAVDDYFLSLPGERHLYDNVDRIVTISETISNRFRALQKPLLTISHGISSEEFDAEPIAIGREGYGLYIGTLDKRVDAALLRKLVTGNPETPFVFVGKQAFTDAPGLERLFRPGQHTNVHYLGVKPFKALKSYIAGARFCLAPMDVQIPGNDLSHHKIFQYLALGKPVFSTVFKEYAPIQRLLYMSNDGDALARQLHDFLRTGEPAAFMEERIAFARTRTYEVILSRIGAFLDHNA